MAEAWNSLTSDEPAATIFSLHSQARYSLRWTTTVSFMPSSRESRSRMTGHSTLSPTLLGLSRPG